MARWWWCSGGIEVCKSSNTVMIYHSIISNNTATGDSTDSCGGGIRIRYDDVILYNTTISHNKATGAGGGIYI